MKPLSKKLLLSAAAVSLSSAMGLWLWQWGIQESAQESIDIALRWKVGNLQRYQLNTHSIIKSGGPLSSSKTLEQIQLHSLLDVETLEVEDEEIILGMQLSKIDLLVNAQFDSETSHALSTPFRVRFTQFGMPIRFEFPDGISIENRNRLESIVRMFQLNLYSDSSWQAKEFNSHGSYSASYQRVGPREFRKHKHDFKSTTVAKSASTIESNEKLRINQQQDWIATMLVNEQLHTQNSSGLKLKISNRASLELSPISPAINRNVWAFTATPEAHSITGGPQH